MSTCTFGTIQYRQGVLNKVIAHYRNYDFFFLFIFSQLFCYLSNIPQRVCLEHGPLSQVSLWYKDKFNKIVITYIRKYIHTQLVSV